MDKPKNVEAFAAGGGGFLIVGHGTRVAEGQQQLLRLASEIAERLAPALTVACFLELAEPSIDEGVRKLAEAGIQKICVVPILLFSAAHDQEDIPGAVGAAAARNGVEVVASSPPLQHHPATLRLSQLRYNRAIRCSNAAGCDRAGACDVVAECVGRGPQVGGNFGWLFVGRGTSDAAAREHMERFWQLRRSATAAAAELAFFVGDARTIEAGLDRFANRRDISVLVIQPHLIFEGLLTQQLRALGDEFAKRTGKRVLVAPPLCGDESLAETFALLAAETIAS